MTRFPSRLLALLLFVLATLLPAALPAAAGASDAAPATLRWGGDASGGGPYIFEGADGKLTGFELELADLLAQKMGRKAEFVQGEWDKLPNLLDLGKFDVVLNGYEWSGEREALWASTAPYYLYKLQLLARKDDASLRAVENLRAAPGQPRKRVGVLGGSAAERYVQATFGDAVEVKSYGDVTSVMGLVEQGQLDATLQDAPVAVHYGRDYPKLAAVGDPVAPGYYCMFVKRTDADLLRRLNGALAESLRDGSLKRIYEKYGLWNKDQEQLTALAAHWPPADNAPAATPGASSAAGAEASPAPVPGTFLARNAWLLVKAAGVTVLLACLAMPLAMLVGLLVALGRLYGPRWLAWPLAAYVEVLRGTPLLLQLFVIYFVLPPALGFSLNEFAAGVLGLALNYSACEAENYRAGLLSIPRGQMEAALSLGMGRATALRRIVVPQAVRVVIPPVTNDFIALFKDTSVCSMIAVTELAAQYRQIINNQPRQLLVFAVLTALLYFLMSYPLSLLARRLELTRKH